MNEASAVEGVKWKFKGSNPTDAGAGTQRCRQWRGGSRGNGTANFTPGRVRAADLSVCRRQGTSETVKLKRDVDWMSMGRAFHFSLYYSALRSSLMDKFEDRSRVY